MYKTLVRSHLDYCDIIYHMPAIIHQPPLGMILHSVMEKLEKGTVSSSSRNYRSLARVESSKNL